jgi:hypothetical protein
MESIAFPSCLADVAHPVTKRMLGPKPFPPNVFFPVVLDGEIVQIPYRIYCSKFTLLRNVLAGGVAGTMALCLGSRHHDGYVRERCVKKLLELDDEWIVPYVIQLLGEYVMEIAQHIERALPALRAEHYAKFLSENEDYFAKTESRAISYWNVYYRYRIKYRQEVPAIRAIAALKRLRWLAPPIPPGR